MLYQNFLGGIAWSLGTFVGFTVVVGILLYILNQLGILPAIGKFFQEFSQTSELLKQITPGELDGQQNLPLH